MKKNHAIQNIEQFKPVEHDEIMGDKYEHPSFGTIEINRWQGTEVPMFGSSIMHHTGITLRISHAHLWRNLSRDWIHSDKAIVEVHMSPSQFAEAMTNLNSGSTPVTLRYIAGQEAIGQPPFQHKVAEFNAEFKQHIDDMSKEFDDAIKLAEETHAQKRLIRTLELLKQAFKSNLPFITTQFSEQIEKTVTEAKAEVEAFTEMKIKEAGTASISSEAPRLMIEGNLPKEDKGENKTS